MACITFIFCMCRYYRSDIVRLLAKDICGRKKINHSHFRKDRSCILEGSLQMHRANLSNRLISHLSSFAHFLQSQ